MKNLTLTLAILISSSSVWAQEDFTNALLKGLGNSGAKKKAELDQVDFQFAMSVNENAGLFDVEQKGEGLARGLYSLKDQKDKSKEEIARDTLEFALQLYNLRMYKLAESSFMDAKSYMETNNLQDDISYLRLISNLGLVYLAQGRLDEAGQYIEAALTESETRQGNEGAAYAANLNSKAKLEQSLARYNEAEALFNESHKLTKKVFGDASMQNAILLNNTAVLYQDLGRFKEAVDLMKQAIAATENAPKKALQGKKSFDNRRFQSNLALLYQVSGNLTESEKVFLEIKKVFENRLQKNNPEYANLLNQLALLYIEMGKNDQVEDLLQKAADVYKKKFGEQNAAYAKTLNDLGNFYRMQNQMDKAEQSLQQSLTIQRTVLSEQHPDYVKSVEDLGILYWKKNDFAKAKTYYSEAMTKSLDFINRYFPPMSEAEKTKYWDVLQPRFQRFYNYAIDASAVDRSVLHEMIDYQIATKGLLLNSTNKIKRAILNSGDNALIQDYLSWIAQKETLARYYALTKEELTNQKIDLSALENQANQLERSLSQRSKDFSQGYSAEKINYTQIQNLLTENEAAIEILRVRGFDRDFTADTKYAALVLTKSSPDPSLVVLDNGSQLETRYSKFYKNAIMQKVDDTYSYDQFWARIAPKVAGKKTIYISPDGVYNQINLNTLKQADGKYLLSQNDFIVLGNSRDLIALKSRKAGAAKKNAFLLGFPNYGGDAVAALPGTKVEIESVSKLLKASGFQVTSYSEREASEKNLKAVKGPQLMHIATHGYFLQDAELATGTAAGISSESAQNNPLLRSGLILAGASPTLKGTSMPDLTSNDNGVLTAYEAMNLDLEGTDLIVLSACETGLGEVKAGEGVYGLQRSFLVAGANALVMSLWKVDDDATQALMTSFYTNWVKTQDKTKAFKQAQLQLMNKYKDPYYWGAFVMIGQ